MKALDLIVFKLINGFSGKFVFFDWLAIFFAQYLAYLMILAVLYLFLKTKNWQKKIYLISFISLSLILSRGILTEIIRIFYYRPRPFLELPIKSLLDHSSSGSFPSGHAAAYFAIAFALYYLSKDLPEIIDRNWNYFFFGSATLVGIARVFCGIHWPLDILGGAILAFLSVFLIRKILPPFWENSEIENDSY